MPASAKPQETVTRPSPCGLPRRLLAMLYDTLLVVAILIIAGIVALPFTGDTQQAGRDVLYTLYLVLVWFAYIGGCWVHAGRTVGMRAWKIRLVNEVASPFDWRRAAIRFGVSLVSAALLGAGFIAALFRPDRATWHDRASDSRLERVRPDSG